MWKLCKMHNFFLILVYITKYWLHDYGFIELFESNWLYIYINKKNRTFPKCCLIFWKMNILVLDFKYKMKINLFKSFLCLPFVVSWIQIIRCCHYFVRIVILWRSRTSSPVNSFSKLKKYLYSWLKKLKSKITTLPIVLTIYYFLIEHHISSSLASKSD